MTDIQHQPTMEEAIQARLVEGDAEAQEHRQEYLADGFVANGQYERAIEVLDGPDSRLRREYEKAYDGDMGLAFYEGHRSAAIAAGNFEPKGVKR